MNNFGGVLLLIIGLLTFSSYKVNSQEEIVSARIEVAEIQSNTEAIVFENDQLIITAHKIVVLDAKNGIHHERITFDYTNKTDNQLTLSFKKFNLYSGSTSTGEGAEMTIILESNSTKKYSEIFKSKLFYSFSKDLKGTINAELQYVILNKISLS